VIYSRNYRSIFPLTPSELRRLASQIEESPDGCWTWIGCLSPGGYGRIALRGALWQVHRIVYELFVGPVPEGRVLHHRCRNKRCCNPAHLDPVTQGENLALDGALCVRTQVRKLKTWCRNGHEVSDDNTRYRTVKGKRIRVCLACEAAAHARRNECRRLKRAAAAALRSSAGDASQPQGGSKGVPFCTFSTFSTFRTCGRRPRLRPYRGRHETGRTATLACPSYRNPAKIRYHGQARLAHLACPSCCLADGRVYNTDQSVLRPRRAFVQGEVGNAEA
jgi:hypothetical protein